MPITISSNLNTSQPFIPLVGEAQAVKLAAVSQVFASIAALKAASIVERDNILNGLPIWTASQQLGVANEMDWGVFRVWNEIGEHAGTAILRPGLPVVLATDDSAILFGNAPPVAGDGADTDVFVDWTGGNYYTKAAGAWSLTGVVYAAGGALPALKTVAGATLAGVGDIPGLSPTNVAKATAQLTPPTSIDANYTFTAADDGLAFYVTGPFTLTVPAGLGWDEGVHVQMPLSDIVSWAVTGAVTINGLTTATRIRTNNPAGVLLCPVAGEVDSYGLTDAALAAAASVSPDGNTYVQAVNGQMNFLVDEVVVGSVTLSAGSAKWNLGGILDPVAYLGTPQTIAQRDALVATSPLTKAGYLVNVVDTGVSEYQRWSGTAWDPVAGAATTVVNNLTTGGTTDALSAQQGVVLNAADVASGAVAGNDLTLTLKGGGAVVVDVTALAADVKVVSGSYNGATEEIDFVCDPTSANFSVPVSALLPVTLDATSSLEGNGSTTGLKLSGDVLAPGNDYFYGTSPTGVKGWYVLPPGTTDLGVTATATTLDVTSSTGADVSLPAATSTLAGVLLPAEKVLISTALQPDLVGAKGDLLVGADDNVAARLAVGTDGQALFADSAAPEGLKWATLGSLSTTPLIASTALPEATGSGAAFLYEVGSAVTINLTAPGGTVGGVATFVASNHGAGAKLLVSDSAAGQWDVSEVGAPASLPLAYGRINASVTLAGTTFTDALPGVLIPFTSILYSSGVTFSGTTGIIPAKAGRYRASWLMMNGSEEFLNDGYFHVVQNGVSVGQVLYNMMEAAGVNQCAGFIDVNVAAGQAVSLHFRTNQGNPGDSLTWDAGSYFQLDQRPSTESVQAGTIVPTPLAFSHARALVAQAVADSTNVLVALDSAISDLSGLFVSGANRIVAAVAGLYRIRGVVPWSTSGNPGIQSATILVNGVAVKSSSTRNNQPMAVTQVETTLQLAAGDYVQLRARQETGAALSTSVATTNLANVFPELEVRQLPIGTVVDPDAVPVVDLAWGQNYWSSFGSMTNTSSAIAVVATASRATLAPASQRIPMIGTGNPASGVFTGSGITRDTANNRFVIQSGGRYSVTADTIGGWMGGVEHGIQLVLNGATVLAISTAHVSGATFGVGTNISWEGVLAANDTLELRAFVQGAGTPYYFEGGTFIVAQQPNHSIVKYTPGDVEVLNLHYGSISGGNTFTATANTVIPVSAWTTNGASFGLTASEAAGTITIAQAGTYRVVASAMNRGTSNTANNSVAIAKNGVVVYTSPAYTAGNAGAFPLPIRAEEVLTLAAGDVITAFTGEINGTAWGSPYLSVSQEPVGMLVDPGTVPVVTLHSATLSAKNVAADAAVYTIPAGTAWSDPFATATTFPVGAQASLIEDPNGLRVGNTFVVQQAGDYDFEFRFINGGSGDAITWFLAVDGVERNRWSMDAGVGIGPGADGHPSSLGYRLRGLTVGQVVTLRHHNHSTATDLHSWAVSLSQLPAHSIVAYTPGDVVVQNLMSGQTADAAITTGQTTNSTTFVDITGASVTLPQAGTYEIEYVIPTNHGTVGAAVTTVFADSLNNPIAGTYCEMAEANGGGVTGPNRGRATVTVTGPATYKARWRVGSGTGTLFNASAAGGSAWVRYEQKPIGELVALATVPVEDVEVLLGSGAGLTGTISMPWNQLQAAGYSHVRVFAGESVASGSANRFAAGNVVPTSYLTGATGGSSRYLATGYADASNHIELYFTNETTADIQLSGANIGTNPTWEVYGIKPQKTVINTTDVAVNDQAASGYFDTGTKRECWGTAVSTGGGTLAITLPGGGFANAGYAFFPSSSNEGFDARETTPAKTATVVNVKTVNLNSTTLAGNVPFSWFAVGTKPA